MILTKHRRDFNLGWTGRHLFPAGHSDPSNLRAQRRLRLCRSARIWLAVARNSVSIGKSASMATSAP